MAGTVRSVFRPGEGQRQLYNGHKRIHGIKIQLIVCPNGMIANLYGPIEGRSHDSFMLARSGISDQIEHFSFGPQGRYSVYMGIQLAHLQTPFRGANPTPL